MPIRAAWCKLVRQNLPHAPGFYVDEIALRLATQAVPDALQRHAIISMAEDVIRHQLTDYDELTKVHGLMPEEARAIVAEDIAEGLAAWGYHASHTNRPFH